MPVPLKRVVMAVSLSWLRAHRDRRVIRMFGERCDLVRTPHVQRHRSKEVFELTIGGGAEESEGAPFTWFQRRTPKAQQMSLRGQLACACGLACTHVSDISF